MSKQNKEEQSAKLKLQEHWHQLIKLKYQGSKQDETHKFQQPKYYLKQRNRILTPNQTLQQDQNISKDIQNIKFRLHQIN